MVKVTASTEGVPPTSGETSTHGIQTICPGHGKITKSKKRFRIISFCQLQYMYSALPLYKCCTSNPFCFSIPAAISVQYLSLTPFTFTPDYSAGFATCAANSFNKFLLFHFVIFRSRRCFGMFHTSNPFGPSTNSFSVSDDLKKKMNKEISQVNIHTSHVTPKHLVYNMKL